MCPSVQTLLFRQVERGFYLLQSTNSVSLELGNICIFQIVGKELWQEDSLFFVCQQTLNMLSLLNHKASASGPRWMLPFHINGFHNSLLNQALEFESHRDSLLLINGYTYVNDRETDLILVSGICFGHNTNESKKKKSFEAEQQTVKQTETLAWFNLTTFQLLQMNLKKKLVSCVEVTLHNSALYKSTAC